KLNRQKMESLKDEVVFLGHRVTPYGLKPDPAKIEAIRNMQKPNNHEAVQRLLGMVSFLARYIPNVSDMVEPLRNIQKQDKEFNWGIKQDEAFRAIKETLCRQPCLAYNDPKKPLSIQCDASSTGLGAVLLQDNHPIH